MFRVLHEIIAPETRAFDVVIALGTHPPMTEAAINSRLGISAAERIVSARIAPVVLLTAFSQRELVERARDAGAMAYVVKPFTAADLMPALEIAASRHSELAALEAEVADLADRFETRKLVDRAKGLLQTKYGLNEPEAFRWIQKTSMDKRLTMKDVASAVIASGQDS
jgi:response regulator NasT